MDAILFLLAISGGLVMPLEAESAYLVNSTRYEQGLHTLWVSPKLTQAARDYAQQLATTLRWAHVGIDGSTYGDRAAWAGYDGEVSEIIAGHFADGPAEIQGWLGSPPHRVVLLSDWPKSVGVGKFGPATVVMFGATVDRY